MGLMLMSPILHVEFTHLCPALYAHKVAHAAFKKESRKQKDTNAELESVYIQSLQKTKVVFINLAQRCFQEYSSYTR